MEKNKESGGKGEERVDSHSTMRSLLLLACLSTVLVSVSSRRDANQRLKTCCARQKAADKDCKRRFCDFNSINQKNMIHFLNTCSPRNQTVPLMWDCASSRADHTECCRKKSVHSSCLPYCSSSEKVPSDYLNHLFCLDNFNAIRDCFRLHLESNPNIFGDT